MKKDRCIGPISQALNTWRRTSGNGSIAGGFQMDELRPAQDHPIYFTRFNKRRRWKVKGASAEIHNPTRT